MKTHILFIVLLVSISSNIQAQILKENEDVREKDFSFEALNDLDSRMAVQLAERQVKTLMSSVVNKALAAVPYVGNTGVQQEMFGTNMKMDELITLNKNYNYKLTAALGNILKLIKETKDGTLTSRASSIARKAKVVKQGVDVVNKIERLKRMYKNLNQNGYRLNDMGRAAQQLDILVKKIEELTGTLIKIWTTADQAEREKEVERVEKELEALNGYIETEISEIDEEAGRIYTQKLNDEIARECFSGIYNYDLEQEQAKQNYEETISGSKKFIIELRNIWWFIVGIIAFISVIGYCLKLFLKQENSISAHIFHWIVTLAFTAFLGSLLQIL